MNGFNDLQSTLQGMGFRQLLPAFTACIAYAVAQGRIAGPAARRWAWGVVVLSAAVFSAMCKRWEHGAVLSAFALAGMGLFTGLVWLISRLIGFRNGTLATPSALEASMLDTTASVGPDSTQHGGQESHVQLPIPIPGASR